jgi:integrase
MRGFRIMTFWVIAVLALCGDSATASHVAAPKKHADLQALARGLVEALVFPSATGTPIDSANLYRRVFVPAAKAAGVPWATFHTLRHTCATTLFRHGLNAKQVQGWLGHHAASFTMDTYVHLLADDLPDASFDALTASVAREAAPPVAADMGAA